MTAPVLPGATMSGIVLRIRGQRSSSVRRAHGDEIRQLRYEMAAIGTILARHAEVLDRIVTQMERAPNTVAVHEGEARDMAPQVRPFTPRSRTATGNRGVARPPKGLGRGLDALLGGTPVAGAGEH